MKDLGDKLNPDTFQAMVRRSVLVSMCDLETPTCSSEIECAVRVAIEYLTGIPGDQRHSSVGNEAPVPRSPLRHTILFLAANPSGTDPRALDREARAIRMELERSGFRTCFELVTRWAAEPLDLLRELRRLRPTVVHFSGHGAPDVAGEPRFGLCFQGSDGRGQLVSTAALEETFGAAGASVKLVVLNACYSELQVQALLTHIDCVVGVSGSIRDDAARSFAIGFYGGLGERESVAVAYKQGCAAITLEGLPDSVRPQLKVRAGIDATRVVLAAVPPRPGPPGQPRRS